MVVYAARGGLPALVATTLGVAAATAVAAVFALLAVRLRRLFPSLTLALGMIVWGICLRWTSHGRRSRLRGDIRPAPRYAAPATGWCWRWRRVARFMWRFPLALRPDAARHRDSETRMQSLGYHVPLHLFIGFTVSGFFAGIAAPYAFFNNFVGVDGLALPVGAPDGYRPEIRTLFGAFVGAAISSCWKTP